MQKKNEKTTCCCTNHTRALLVTTMKARERRREDRNAHSCGMNYGSTSLMPHPKHLHVPLNPARIAHIVTLIDIVLGHGLEKLEVRDYDAEWLSRCVVFPENLIHDVGKYASLLHTPPATNTNESALKQNTILSCLSVPSTKISINRYTISWFYQAAGDVRITTHPLSHKLFTSKAIVKTWIDEDNECGG